MPKPIYIICSESGVEDRNTGLLSFVNVLEKLTMWKPGETPNPNAQRIFGFRVSAAWMKEPTDNISTVYEWELLFEAPVSKASHVVVKGSFSFADEPSKSWSRTTVNVHGVPPADGSGILRVQHRIRPVGSSGEWLVQEYPLVIEEATTANSVGQAASPA